MNNAHFVCLTKKTLTKIKPLYVKFKNSISSYDLLSLHIKKDNKQLKQG